MTLPWHPAPTATASELLSFRDFRRASLFRPNSNSPALLQRLPAVPSIAPLAFQIWHLRSISVIWSRLEVSQDPEVPAGRPDAATQYCQVDPSGRDNGVDWSSATTAATMSASAKAWSLPCERDPQAGEAGRPGLLLPPHQYHAPRESRANNQGCQYPHSIPLLSLLACAPETTPTCPCTPRSPLSRSQERVGGSAGRLSGPPTLPRGTSVCFPREGRFTDSSEIGRAKYCSRTQMSDINIDDIPCRPFLGSHLIRPATPTYLPVTLSNIHLYHKATASFLPPPF